MTLTLRGLAFPDDLWYDLQRDLWLQPRDSGIVRIGITSLGVRLAGPVFMCRPRPVGRVLAFDEALAVVELSKSVVAIHTPLGGTVAAVNERLEDDPAVIERDPYGAGWLVDLQRADAGEGPDAAWAHGSGLAERLAERIDREPPDARNGAYL